MFLRSYQELIGRRHFIQNAQEDCSTDKMRRGRLVAEVRQLTPLAGLTCLKRDEAPRQIACCKSLLFGGKSAHEAFRRCCRSSISIRILFLGLEYKSWEMSRLRVSSKVPGHVKSSFHTHTPLLLEILLDQMLKYSSRSSGHSEELSLNISSQSCRLKAPLFPCVASPPHLSFHCCSCARAIRKASIHSGGSSARTSSVTSVSPLGPTSYS
jgi:hypothetical protein